MAEGGVTTTTAKSRPVPPPKPSCSSSRRPSEELCKTTVNARNTTCGLQEKKIKDDQPQHPAGRLAIDNADFQMPSVKQLNINKAVSCKPPLLPKPSTSLIHDSPSKSTASMSLPKQLNAKHGAEKLSRKSGISYLPSSETKQLHDIDIRKCYTDNANKRPFPKVFIPYVRNGKEQGSSPSSPNVPVCGKAPVAKLDEFDNLCDQVNPTRPPRSPKNKTFVAGPFANSDLVKPVLPIKKRQLIVLHHSGKKDDRICDLDKSKSASLSRSDAFYLSEIKSKSCSLGRSNIERYKQLIESHGSSTNTQHECSPIPPPRRRRKSVTEPSQSPEVATFQQIVSIFSLENQTDSYVPVYAQVNYNLKKNRRVELQNNRFPDQAPSQQEEQLASDIVLADEDLNIIASSVNKTTADNSFDDISDRLCGEAHLLGNETAGGLQVNVLDSENKHVSKTAEINESGSFVLKNESLEDQLMCSDTLFIKEDKDIDNHDSATISDKDKGEDDEHTSGHFFESQVVMDECSDLCADCISTRILEHICDDTLSSSKLDWQSVKSSLHSSSNSSNSSNAALETVDQQFNSDAKDLQSKAHPPVLESLHVSVQDSCSEEIVNVLCSIRNAEICSYDDQHKSINCDDQTSKLQSYNNYVPSDLNTVSLKHKTPSNSCNGRQCEIRKELSYSIPTKIHMKNMPCSSVKVHNKDYKRQTSSLPTQSKLCRRASRRQSWSSSKDHSYSSDWEFVSDWQQFKHIDSLWLDEGDLSSGTLADLDSSDNAARQSSLEDVDVKSKDANTNHVGKKIASWWGSLGKGHKKHRGSKRLSQFYCEQQGSSGIDEQALKSSASAHEDNSSSTLEGVSSPTSSVVVPCQDARKIKQENTSCVPNIENVNTDCKSETPISEDSFETDQHSDSEVEDVNSTCDIEVNQSLAEDQHNEKKAFYIAQELMTSERVFISVLKLLNVNFKQAIEKAGIAQGQPVIPEADLCRIINSLPQLQRLNEDLLRDLEERIENWTSIKKIADVIVKKGPFLKLYTTYIQNFEAQCNYFDECCQKYQKFAKVVRDFEASPLCQKLSIKHFMLKPVQRIPQYRLLLDDYSRHLDPCSPDYEDTQTALRIVSDVAEHANRSIKLGDHLSKLLQLQSQLDNYEIIKPGRIVLKDGELFKLSRKDRQPRYFILLNDCLLYTSYHGSGPASGLKVNSELPLGGMKVTTPQAEDYHNEFSIISSTRSFTLSARSLNERQEWVDVLQNAIKEHTSRQLSFQNQKISLKRSDGSSEPFKLGKEAPVWIQDGRVTKCQSCIAEFTVTFRRHHCRACGKVVCGDCSDFRAPLQYMKFQAARVCAECYYTLLKEFENPANKIGDVIKSELAIRQYNRNAVENIRSQFKKLGLSSGKKTRKYVPQRLLEVTANDTGSQISGWLQRRNKRSWKRFWFVLKEQVLYVYKASEDVVALETIPVLGYRVEPMKEMHFQLYEGIDARFVFQLAHPGQLPLVFSADSENLANRWISAMQEATVLK